MNNVAEHFTHAFVKGAGNTTGVVTILGIASLLWYSTTLPHKEKKRQQTQTEGVVSDQPELDLQDVQETRYKRVLDILS